MIRTRDSQSPVLTHFTGVPMFDYNPAVVLQGRLERFDSPGETPIKTARADVPGVACFVGEVIFDLAGIKYRLAAEDGTLGTLTVAFFDKTNNVSSANWRKVELTRPRPDNSVVVDFNRAINYPSAFTDFGTCPMPVAGNRIAAAIEAGERHPRKGPHSSQ